MVVSIGPDAGVLVVTAAAVVVVEVLTSGDATACTPGAGMVTVVGAKGGAAGFTGLVAG